MLKLKASEFGKGHAILSYVPYPLVVAMCAAGSPCSLGSSCGNLKLVCRKYVKSQKARGGTGTPVHTRHRHSVEYDEETREEVKRETRGGNPRFSFPYPVFLLVNL